MKYTREENIKALHSVSFSFDSWPSKRSCADSWLYGRYRGGCLCSPGAVVQMMCLFVVWAMGKRSSAAPQMGRGRAAPVGISQQWETLEVVSWKHTFVTSIMLSTSGKCVVQQGSELCRVNTHRHMLWFLARTWASWPFWDPTQDIPWLYNKVTAAETACCDHRWSPICAMPFHGSSQGRVSPEHWVCLPVAKHLECKFDLTVQSSSCTRTASAKHWKTISFSEKQKKIAIWSFCLLQVIDEIGFISMWIAC